jgi:hypothetical protein
LAVNRVQKGRDAFAFSLGREAGQARWCLPHPPTVRFSFHCGHSAALPRTAAVGHNQTHAVQHIGPLIDDLVGAGEHGLRNLEPEQRGLEVDELN